MYNTRKSHLLQFWSQLKYELFVHFLRKEDHLLLPPVLSQVTRLLDFTEINRFIPSSRGFVGRLPKDHLGTVH
jgi:hypothetical protein